VAPPPPPAVDDDRALLAGAGPSVVAPTRPVWWKVGGLAVVGLAGCAYVAINDPNTSTLFPACPFRTITGLDCPGCGITRALHALFNADPVGALDQNLLFVLAVPVLLWWALRSALRSSGRATRAGPAFQWRAWMTWALVATISGFWVVRNIDWGPFAWLQSGLS
jgi:hypothetical protein